MSNDQAFDPSMLDGKDRNELVAIATSLGQKPASRAKKADIIELIMRLVGAEPASEEKSGEATASAGPGDSGSGDSGGGTAADGSAGSEDASEAPQGGGSTSDGSKGSGQGSGHSKGADRGAEGQPGRSGQQPQNAQKDQNAQQDQGRQQPQKGQQSRQGQGDRQQNDGGSQQSQGGRQGGGNQQSDKGNQQSDKGRDETDSGNRADPPAPQAEDGDGNRRRRRRGRDRNRNQDDEQVQAEPVDVAGIVDLRDEGYGFLRIAGYLPSPQDAYISIKQVRQFGLRRGDLVIGRSRAANRNEKNPALIQIDSVNDIPVADLASERPDFEKLTPLFPDSHLKLEQPEYPENLTARLIDLLAPIGKGQRGMIVAPPKAGKTTVLKQIVRAIERNHPDVHVIVLLIDERPEEVTDMKRWMLHGEVAASTFDRPTEEHIAIADLVLERAKRMVENGRDVAVVLDGITRLTRAYNLAAPANGRTMAGGMDASALYPPKRFFGAARNIEEGGSLTILATALVETNTRLDEVIFEEFKGTGNMELRLDRSLAERRVFPAIDVTGSGTRHEELLHDRKALAQIHRLRRLLSDLAAENGSGVAGMEMLAERMRTKRTNAELLDELQAP